MNTSKKKLAILGGGVGSMVSAFEITSSPDWKERYESITVYQMGWRIGGKGASGRGPHGRIEEHGLHMWLGFYNNAFDAIQRAYSELGRPAGAPLATWTDAFMVHDYVVAAQEFNGEWYPWEFDFPKNPKVPGKGDPLPSLWEYVPMIISWLETTFVHSKNRGHIESQEYYDEHCSVLHKLGDHIKDLALLTELTAVTLAENIIRMLGDYVSKLDKDITGHTLSDHNVIVVWLQELKNWILKEFEKSVGSDIDQTRFFILMDTGITVLTGLLSDGVLLHPDKLDSIDGEDLQDWLSRHGAADITAHSAIMKSLYDLVFAYEGGDSTKPNFAAGTALRCALRICFTYKGGLLYRMEAGMGDTVFTPFYEVLKRRGVDFKFFHCVKNLGLSADKKSVGTITIGRQVTLKNATYDPYVNIKDLDCWPSTPNYDQIVEGEELQQGNINLESFYSQWADRETITLTAGADFDEVLLGISIGAIPFLCGELVAANPSWQAMVTNVQTVRTMACQTWMNKTLNGLGWTDLPPVMTGYIDPQNTYADMAHLIPKEDWPAEMNVQDIAYFCGQMMGDIPPPEHTEAPTNAEDWVTLASNHMLNQHSIRWWKNAVDAEGKLDRVNVADSYFHANIDPSERYVLSLKGSTRYRLDGGKSGFSNLFITGDWTRCGLNAGCVEAATISGMLASNAMTGYPPLDTIDGYKDL